MDQHQAAGENSEWSGEHRERCRFHRFRAMIVGGG